MVLILPRIPVFALLHWHQSQKFYIFSKLLLNKVWQFIPNFIFRKGEFNKNLAPFLQN
jgi:hypothetical protein